MAKRTTSMVKRQTFIVLVACVAALFCSCLAGAQSGEVYRARLSTVPVDATMLARIAGSGSLRAVLVGSKLAVTGTFGGLRSPATHASIHL